MIKSEEVSRVARRNSQVKCFVDSCHYWAYGNNCNAEEIEVDNQAEIGMEVGRLGEEEADTSRETFCRTFKPRSQDN